MTKYAINERCMVGKHHIENLRIYKEDDNIIIETRDKIDLSKGVKL